VFSLGDDEQLSRFRAVSLAAIAALVAPSLLLLYYIGMFGVNVVFWDEWEMIPVLQKAMSGTLSFSDLFAQHNEHRILFPRIAMLALGRLTQYNTIAEMLFSWVLICATGLLIFFVYQKKHSRDNYAKHLLVFLPVSALLFSFRQYESILWGFTCQIYLMIFGAVAAFVLLQVSKRIDIWLMLSLASAILASFSFFVGLAAWPAGLVQILLLESKEKWRKAILWCFVGFSTISSYFYGFFKPTYHPPLDLVLKDPIGTGEYFVALIGAPFSYDATMAAAFGSVTVLITAYVIVQLCKGRLLRGNGIWLSLILFVAASSLLTTIGRSGFGIQQALTSRYTPITVLGIIGVYLLSVNISKKLSSRSLSFGFHALLTLILVGLVVSYGAGWRIGQKTKQSREIGAYVLMTYKQQSDENLRVYLYPDPAIVRERAQFLEQQKLNVFRELAVNSSTVNAHVDGKQTRIYQADGLVRVVYLGEGEHTVEFMYEPESFKIGSMITIISAVALLMLTTIEKLKARTRKNHPNR
jgi:hypothetical protein